MLLLLPNSFHSNNKPATKPTLFPVLYTNNPVAGLGIVIISVPLVKVTRGGKKPLSVENTSSFAEGLGVVVPMPVWANIDIEKINKTSS